MADLPSAVRRQGWLVLPWTCALVMILVQITWVLVPAGQRGAVTVISVSAFLAASATHAAVTRGISWALGYLVITIGLGLLVEALGTATGVPFGPYTYSDDLGPRVLSVPLIIPMAWAMMAYPCLLVARSLTTSRLWTCLAGGWLLAAWDLFLDPQMVGEGYWIWQVTTPALPGIPGIPAVNFAGWLVTGVLMMALLDLLPRREGSDVVPSVLIAWTYLSSILASIAFFGRPWVGLWGALGMGIVLLPWGLQRWKAGRS